MITSNPNPAARKRRSGPGISLLLIFVALAVGLIPFIADQRPNGLTVLSLIILATACGRVVGRGEL